MTAGARSPDELDTLLEDAWVLNDRAALDAVFDEGAILGEVGGREVRGGEAVARALMRLWAQDRIYVAQPRRIMQTRDTALIIADSATHVLRRGEDRAWRAAITLLDLGPSTGPEEA